MNAIYVIIPIWGQRRFEFRLKDDVRLWKNNAKEYIPKWNEDVPEGSDGRLWLSLIFYGSWFTKAGKFRVIDLPNLIKVTVDVIAEKLGFDDCMIWEHRNFRKVQDTSQTKVEAELGYL